MEKLLSSTSNHTLRIQKWILRLQAYDTVIQYQTGSSNPADHLSRHPSLPLHQLNDQSAEHYNNMITYHAAPKSISIDQIGNETCKDITLQQLIESIQTNNWSKHLQPFYTARHQLSAYNKVLLKDLQIVISKKLQHLFLQNAHLQHQGIQNTKNLLRQKVWWPTLDQDVE